jgi:spermidine synthase
MTPTHVSDSQRRLPWLFLLFIGSGCAALIYEVVWLQLLQLVIGLTTISLGILLGTYMGGMCLGSLLLARFIPPTRHPLRVYAALELGIGVIGIAVLFLVPWVSDFYTRLSGPGIPGMILRGIVAAVCLLPPTLLMGATLPAISRWVETTPKGVSWLGFFYGGNLFGAVIGCLGAGFYLLRLFDVATATYVAAAINLVVSLAGFGLAWRSANQPAPVIATDVKPTEGGSGNRVIYVVAALSGLTALGAEVVWTRLLSLLFGGTVYTFSIILAVFLIGLGLGSTAASHLARTMVRPGRALGFCQLGLAATIAWAALMITRSLPHWPVDPSISLSPWYTFQLDFARCLWTVLPAACLWGASFPLALAAAAPGSGDPGRLVGRLYAANTVGAIVGSLAFSLAIIPLLGTQAAQRILVLVAAGSGGVALLRSGTPSVESPGAAATRFRWKTGLPALAGVGVLVALLAVTINPTPWSLIAYGRFVAAYGKRLAPEITEESKVPTNGTLPDIYATYVGEGLNGSVAVTKWTSGVRNFHSAGKVQASSDPKDMRLQRMLGHLSALATHNPESVLVVACGAGVTAGSFVVHPEVKRIVICDIEPLVPTFVAPMFAKENHNVIRDPRTEVVTDDGRHFIRTTREKFDVITSDPIDPWVKGCAALNTLEYYEMCKAHLKPGGVMSLWIPLYESNTETSKSVIATFFQAFPHGILFSNDDLGDGYDAVLLGQVEPTRFNLDTLQTMIDNDDHAALKQSLREAGFPTVYSLFSTYAGQAPDLLDWTKGAQINTDANLRVQYLAGLSFNSYIAGDILADITRNRRFPENLFEGSEARKQAVRFAILGKAASQ